ncbi:transposase [Candidatus Bipolaricaulota bacterium]|nr:transposase [Candidatus Bipolaricaulota bacterium]
MLGAWSVRRASNAKVRPITTRGNARKGFFLEEEWLKFFKVLEDVIERYNWICHAYCLMPNHYHLLFENTRWQPHPVYYSTVNLIARRVADAKKHQK